MSVIFNPILYSLDSSDRKVATIHPAYHNFMISIEITDERYYDDVRRYYDSVFDEKLKTYGGTRTRDPSSLYDIEFETEEQLLIWLLKYS